MNPDDLVWIALALGLPMIVLPWVSPENVQVRLWCFRIIFGLYWTYLAWRLATTLPDLEPTLPVVYSLALLALELVQAYAMYQFQSRLIGHCTRHEEADHHEGWHGSLARLPVVDILIPTYNESWSIVEKTLIGALNQDYPSVRVWICDDGRRPEFKAKCVALGVGYVTRNDNKHAKAGNLNNALAALGPDLDFVAVCDADFIPRRRFLSRALALFHDPKVGLVQTPQYHLNQDPLQAAFDVWQEWPDQQRHTFNVALPAFDSRGAAYCCGTSFVARAGPLNEIGGFPTEAVTEDVLTSIKMGMKGYRTVYLREVLTTGLAAEGLHEYMVQRGRWCLGTVQIGWWLFSLGQGERRSLRQKVLAMEPFIRWGYSSLIRVLFMAVPVIYWYTGIVPFRGRAGELLFYSFPMVFFERTYATWVSRGAVLPIVQQAYNLLAAVAVVPAFIKGLVDRRAQRFRVTDKGVLTAGRVIHWGTLQWFLGYLLLVAGGAAYHIVFDPSVGPSGDFVPLTLVWTALTVTTVLVASATCIEAPRRRTEYRYAARERVDILLDDHDFAGSLLDISVSGVRLRSPTPLPLGALVHLEIRNVEGPILGRAVRAQEACEYGVALTATDAQRHALIRKIFCTDEYVKPPEEGSVSKALFAIVRRFACVVGLARRWNPMCAQERNGERHAALGRALAAAAAPGQ